MTRPVLRVSTGRQWGLNVMELVVTAALIFVIFGATTNKRCLDNTARLAVSSTVVIISLAAIPRTDASANPAWRSAPALVGDARTDRCIYRVGPLIGTWTMGYAYKLLFQNNSNDYAGPNDRDRRRPGQDCPGLFTLSRFRYG